MSQDGEKLYLSRREALKLFGLGAGAWFLAACSRQGEQATATLAPSQSHTPVPEPTATTSAEVIGLAELPEDFAAARLTPIENFYEQSYSNVAKVDSLEWQLAVTGETQQSLRYSLVDLKNLPRMERMHTLECIGNPLGGNLIGNQNWVGVSLPALLEAAGVSSEADHLYFYCADDYFTSIPIELALDERSMLVYEMGGEPLPVAHGFPLRAVLPGVYGQKQPKWINAIHAAKSDKLGTWEERGWSNEATIQINSKIETPRLQQYIPAGEPFYLTGWAMANTTGVELVDISTDDGENWEQATLLPGPHTGVWTMWHWVWENPTPGTHTLVARAKDGEGAVQSGGGIPGILDNVFPNGSSLMHKIVVNVV